MRETAAHAPSKWAPHLRMLEPLPSSSSGCHVAAHRPSAAGQEKPKTKILS